MWRGDICIMSVETESVERCLYNVCGDRVQRGGVCIMSVETESVERCLYNVCGDRECREEVFV